VKVKVLDIDRERQRISLGLKQTQSDPWQQVLDSYGEGDVVEGRVTKVVTFGAFVEILPGVEGLVHISELAAHHVENPREVVSQGDPVNVLILEIDGERRRLSLSLKRVEEGMGPVPRADGGESVHSMPDLRLSEEAFPTSGAVAVEESVDDVESGEDAEAVETAEAVDAAPEDEPVAETSAEAVETVEAVEPAPDDEPVDEAVADAPESETEAVDEVVAEATESEPDADEADETA
jgi:small subunit ribosomal protein S1